LDHLRCGPGGRLPIAAGSSPANRYLKVAASPAEVLTVPHRGRAPFGKGLRETRSWPTGCRRNPNTAGEIMTKDGVSVLVGSSVRDVAIQLLDVLPMPQHSGSLRQRPSRRHWRARSRSDRFQRLDRGVPRWIVVDFRSSQQCPAYRQNRRRARPDAADIPLINSFGPHVLKSFRVWTYEVFDAPASAPNFVLGRARKPN
jgi:hypothetical protein